MKNLKLIKTNTVEGEEQVTEEVEAKVKVKVKEEVIKEEEAADITTTTTSEEITGGTDIEKTARRDNLGEMTHPKNLLQAVEGARNIERKAQ